MSLAQRVERPQQFGGDTPPASVATRTAIPVDFRDITRRFVPPPPSPAPIAVTKTEPRVSPKKESELAFELLSEVSKALPAAMERCEKLEAELADIRDLAKSEAETANDVAREWQQIAGALRLQVEGLEKGLKAMRQRAEAAEAQVANARQVADHSQHAAAEAECLASLFQEKVISSFGAGSPLHPLLDAFRSKPSPAA